MPERKLEATDAEVLGDNDERHITEIAALDQADPRIGQADGPSNSILAQILSDPRLSTVGEQLREQLPSSPSAAVSRSPPSRSSGDDGWRRLPRDYLAITSRPTAPIPAWRKYRTAVSTNRSNAPVGRKSSLGSTPNRLRLPGSRDYWRRMNDWWSRTFV
jgi:hypothetical protein